MATLEIRSPRTHQELCHCVSTYIDSHDKSVFTIDKEFMKFYIDRKVKAGAFMRIAYLDDEMVGVMFADKIFFPLLNKQVVAQEYFWVKAGCKSKLRVMRELHKALEVKALELKIDTILSGASIHDNCNVFAKLLENWGWSRQGSVAFKFLQGVPKSVRGGVVGGR